MPEKGVENPCEKCQRYKFLVVRMCGRLARGELYSKDTYTDRLRLGHMSDEKNRRKNEDPTVVRTRDRTICNRMLYH